MTEAEWLSCADPFAMFAHLGEKAGWRKRQLYCVACWNRVLHLLTDGYSRKALAYLEAHTSFDWNDQDAGEYEQADEAVGDVDCELVNRFWSRGVSRDEDLWEAIESGNEEHLTDWTDLSAIESAAALAAATESLDSGHVRSLYGVHPPVTAAELAARIESNAAVAGEKPLAVWRTNLRALAELVREVFGNPFRPARIEPAWLAWNGGVAAALAQSIDEDAAFDRMPILGDALEDAGCSDAGLLAHLRGPGPHVPGCWALDLILDRERVR